MAQKYDESEGVWRTVGGRRIFIRNGQSLQEAMKASGKFNNTTIKEKRTTKQINDEYEALSKKMQADDYYYKPEDDKKLKALRAEYDQEVAKGQEDVNLTAYNKRERATQMYLDGDISKEELINDYFGGNKKGAEEYINDLAGERYVKEGQKKPEDIKEETPKNEWEEKYKDYTTRELKNAGVSLALEGKKEEQKYVMDKLGGNESSFDNHDYQIGKQIYQQVAGDKKAFLQKMRQDYGWDNEDAKALYEKNNGVWEAMTNKDLQKQVMSDVQKSFEGVKVDLSKEREEINLESKIDNEIKRMGSDPQEYNLDAREEIKRNIVGQDKTRNELLKLGYDAKRKEEIVYTDENGNLKTGTFAGVGVNGEVYLDREDSDFIVDNTYIENVQRKNSTNNSNKNFEITQDTYFGKQKLGEWEASSKEQAEKEFLESNPQYKDGKKGHLSFTEKGASENSTNNDTGNQIKQQSLDYDDIWENKMSRADKAKINQLNNDYAQMQGSPESRARVREEQEKIYQKYANTESKKSSDNEKYKEFSQHNDYIRTISPYDDTDYAYASKQGDKWVVKNPIKGETREYTFDTKEEAMDEMIDINKHIRSGESVRGYEGVLKYHQPNDIRREPSGYAVDRNIRKQEMANDLKFFEKMDKNYKSNEEWKALKEDYESQFGKYKSNIDEIVKNSMNDKIRNKAYQKYMKEHPGSKMTLDEFLKKK